MRVPNPGRDAARGPRHAGTTGGHRSAGCPQPLRRSCWPVLPLWREPRWRTKTTSWPRSALSSRRFRCRPLSPPPPLGPGAAPAPAPRSGAQRASRLREGCAAAAHPRFRCGRSAAPHGLLFSLPPAPHANFERASLPPGWRHRGRRARGGGGHGGAGLIPALTSASPGGSPLGGGPPRPPPPPLRSLPVPPCLKAAP